MAASRSNPGHRPWWVYPEALFLVLLLLASCGAGRNASQARTAPEDTEYRRLPAVVNRPEARAFGDSVMLRGIVSLLASDRLKGRDTGSEGLEEAAVFLEGRLREYGVRPYFETYRDTLLNSRDIAYNIVGFIPGSDPERAGEYVVLGAHYDHIGIVPRSNGDGIANGANDNASGTAMVLEFARYFSTGTPPARSLLIAFFSAEERGLLGSEHLAGRLFDAGVPLHSMLNFEMTGVPMHGKRFEVYITGFDKSNLAELANRYGGENLVGYLPAATEFNLFQRSDNFTFYKRFRIPAHTFSTFDFTNYPYYHQPGDESEAMNYGHMARLLDRLIPVVRGVADSGRGELKLN